MIELIGNLLSEWAKDWLLADAYLEETQELTIVLEPSRVDEISWGVEKGIGFRRVNQDFVVDYRYSSNLDYQSLKKLLKNEELKSANSSIECKDLSKVKREDLFQRVEYLKKIASSIPKDSRIIHYKVGLKEVVKRVKIVTLNGFVEEVRNYYRVVAIVTASCKDRLETGYEVAGRSQSFESVKELEEFFKVGEKASALALNMLESRRVKAGIMSVVLAGEAGGTMIHEAVGHGLEADHAEEGLSVYAGRTGEKVANSNITVIDDPTIPGLYGSYKVDDEGVKASKVILIENGILKNFLYDKLTALKYGKDSNGHGRRQSFRHTPIPRMANTYIAPGEQDPEDIIKSVRKGLLVKKMGGGEVNPLTGDFVFEVREGYYIEDGEVKYPVKGATLVGNGPKVLEQIDMIGKDLHFEPGVCGKDGQGVPVSDAQPTLRIPEITVGGE